MKKKTVLFILIFALFYAFSPAGNTPMSLGDCLKMAMEKNRDIKSAQRDVDIAYGNRTASISRILPRVSVSAGYGYNENGDSSYSAGVSAGQSLFTGLANLNSIRAANENVKAAEARFDDALAKLVLDVTTRYIGLFRAQEQYKQNREITERRKTQAEIVKAKYESGRENKGSYLSSKASVTDYEFQVRSAERAIEFAGMQLSSVLGYEKPEILAASGIDAQNIGIEEGEPEFERLALKTPQMRQLMAAKEAAGLNSAAAKGELLPDVSASWSYSRSGETLPLNDGSWRAGLSASFNLFSGFSNVTSVMNAEAGYIKAELSEKQGLIDKMLSLKNAWNSLKDARENLQASKEYLEAAEARAEISQAQYSAGLITYDSFIIIENDLVKYQNNYINAQAGLMTAAAQWEYEKGGNTDEE